MQRISDKSRDALYEAVAEEITQARIKIEKLDRKSTRLNSSHSRASRMPSSA